MGFYLINLYILEERSNVGFSLFFCQNHPYPINKYIKEYSDHI